MCRENAKMDMAGEVMDDTLDDALGDADAEDETNDVVNQVHVCFRCVLHVSGEWSA